MIGNLAHVAIAVPDLEAAVHQYKNIFGAFVSAPQDLPLHGVRVAMVKLPNTVIELMTPLGKESPIENFLKKNPQGGIHHLCYEVTNITKARDTLTTAGVRVIGDGVPKPGYHGNPVLFFHPKDCLGVLIELEEIGTTRRDKDTDGPPLSSVHRPSATESLKGAAGVGITFEIDFQSKTPDDNEEGA